MKDSNRQFEETGAFLDLMSKRERRRWEKEQAKLKEQESEEQELEENENKSNDEEPDIEQSAQLTESESSEETSTQIEEETSIDIDGNNDTEIEISKEKNIENNKSKEDLEKELEKTKQLLSLTREIAEQKTVEDDYLTDDEVIRAFNPIIPLGLAVIAVFVFFTYITAFSKYDNNTFILINSIITLLLTFCFSLTALSNRKHVKVFAIIDLMIILVFVVFNGISIIDYDNIYNKVEEFNKIEEEKNENKKPINNANKNEDITKTYNCTNEENTISVNIKTKNDYIVHLVRAETFNTDELAQEVISFYENINGITTDFDDNTVTIEFDFEVLDINQYKIAIKKHNEAYRLTPDFTYIENDKINYQNYINTEIKNLTCSEKKEDN